MTADSTAGGAGRFGKAQALLDDGVRNKAFSAAVLLAARGEEIVFNAAAGDARLSSVFDVASLTKPMVAALFFILAREGKVSPEGRVSDVIPLERHYPAGGEMRFLHLLAHTSGLPAWKPLYEEVLSAGEREGRRIWGTQEGHDRIVDSVARMSLESAPGIACAYSDLGFILLGRAIELVSFMPLEKVLQRRLAEPLQMRDTSYLPLERLSECETGRLVSTGYSDIRGKEKLGEPDDENAAAMGGVAGHAGVFSTAFDLFLFAREVLRARRGEGRVLDRATALRMTTRLNEPPGCPRTPGWDTPTVPAGKVSQAGRHFPEGSFGHLGYTGCSLWIDPAREAVVALLTDRIRYGKQNDGLKILRPLIHDLVMEEMFN